MGINVSDAYYTASVSCDHPGCSNVTPDMVEDSTTRAEEEAAENAAHWGWSKIDGNWYCPRHAEAQ